MALPKYTPTLCAMATGNFTRPDNVFTSSSILDSIISCSMLPEQCPTLTNNFLIITILDLSLEAKIDSAIQDRAIQNETDFWQKLNALTKCISKTIKTTVPLTCPSPFAKCWWTKEIATKRTTTRRLGRQSYNKQADPSDPIHKQYKRCRNEYGALIETTKKECCWDTS
ncbi:hypothetical protein K439DRAFT_1646984 [Ramaria rubella]|nr:hypothetical protein K439DRAFT_1646984 [Ramaria rubella]